MDLSKFKKINRSQKSFEINDENSGYEAKGFQQKINGSGFGVSFSMTNEFISESDPKGFFPLLGKTFDEILSFANFTNNEKNKKLSKKETKQIAHHKELKAPEVEQKSKSFFESLYDFWLK